MEQSDIIGDKGGVVASADKGGVFASMGAGVGEPFATKSNYIQNIVTVDWQKSLDRLSKAETGDVQEIASAQMEILSSYYNVGIEQSSRSFRFASYSAVVGFVFFIIVIIYSIWKPQQNVVSVASLGTALSGFISAICFYLYNKSTSQLSGFHEKLYMIQRYLLANSMCEGLDGQSKEETRSAIIKELASVRLPQNKPLNDQTP